MATGSTNTGWCGKILSIQTEIIMLGYSLTNRSVRNWGCPSDDTFHRVRGTPVWSGGLWLTSAPFQTSKVRFLAGNLPYFRWFPKDAETDESYAVLSDEELGFFHRCLNRSWMNDGLPADPLERAKVLQRHPKTADRLWIVVGKMFAVNSLGRYINPRQERERLHAKSKSLKASEAVLSRYVRSTSVGSSVGTNDLPRAYGSGSVSVFESEIKKGLLAKFSTVLETWQLPCGHCGTIFPCNQVELGFAAWERLVDSGRITEATVPEVLDGLKRHRESSLWHKNNGKYVMAVSTFLGYQSNGLPAAPRWTDRPAKEEF